MDETPHHSRPQRKLTRYTRQQGVMSDEVGMPRFADTLRRGISASGGTVGSK